MKEKTIKTAYGIIAFISFITFFYIQGLYETATINVKDFAVRFTVNALAFIWSCYQAGAFNYGNGQDDD